ncbi:RNA ligase 2 [Erwinia phage Hena1]|uniref:RNA ligase 2 n=1 Tax=Erwinia phage Hena1 TaxID=2678601 RepID=A0A6B9J9X2_9CAUD|nr:RNA ligase [Erwinia phage Hena1]QGZ16363.1 RNA ligase 2 [Erwinia phage Hena1]
MTKPIKYPSTSQLRQVVRTVKESLTFDGIDSDGNIKRKTPEDWVVPYFGTVKLHGTNGSIVFYSDDEIVYQSKERVLGIGDDNQGFMARMIHIDHKRLLDQVRYICETRGVEFKFPVEVAGEWAGRGIQKGVALNEVDPFFAIFRIAVGKDEHDSLMWLPPAFLMGLTMADVDRVFNILDFGFWMLDIDFSQPELFTNGLIEVTQKVEEECPAGKKFGVSGIGEGVVWSPMNPKMAQNSGFWFKVKGEKHSVSKVKTLAAVDPERLASIQEFVDYAVTENRLNQGLEEVGKDIQKIGEFLSWMNRDIIKEEGDVMKESNLVMKDVAKFLSNKARAWYLAKLNEGL